MVRAQICLDFLEINIWQYAPKALKVFTAFDPVSQLLEIFLIIRERHKDMVMDVHPAFIYIIKNWKLPKCPQKLGLLGNILFPSYNMMEYNPVIKKNHVLEAYLKILKEHHDKW